MQRFTISIDDELAGALSRIMKEKGYGNRSEVFRDLLREKISHHKVQSGEGCGLAVVSYFVDPTESRLQDKLNEIYSANSALVLSSFRSFVSANVCIVTAILKGNPEVIEKLGNEIVALKNVQNGSVRVYALEN